PHSIFGLLCPASPSDNVPLLIRSVDCILWTGGPGKFRAHCSRELGLCTRACVCNATSTRHFREMIHLEPKNIMTTRRKLICAVLTLGFSLSAAAQQISG